MFGVGCDIIRQGALPASITLYSSVSYLGKVLVSLPAGRAAGRCELESLKDKQTSKSLAGTFNFSPGELELIKGGTSSSIFI